MKNAVQSVPSFPEDISPKIPNREAENFKNLAVKFDSHVCFLRSRTQLISGFLQWHAFWVMRTIMAADWKDKVLDLFSRENGPFSVHELMDRFGISNNAVVNAAVFELLRQGVIVQTSEIPPMWELSSDRPVAKTEEICTDANEGKR